MADGEDIDTIFNKIYTYSKIVGTFSFTLKNGTFEISYTQFIYSTILYAPIGLIIWDIIFDELSIKPLLRKLMILTNVQLLILPPSNMIWLFINLNKMSSYVRSIIWIHERIHIKLTLSIWFKIYFIFLMLINITISFMMYDENGHSNWENLPLVTFRFFPVLVIVDQFSGALDIVNMIFVETRNQLKAERAEELIEVVELLRESCRILNHCYVPQILTFLYTAVIYEVTILYVFATLPLHILLFSLSPLLSLLIFTSAILRLTTSCWRASQEMLSVITTCTLLMVQFGN
ncbi:Gustatory receptor 92c [Halyomorpha halys]|nr:Gustatory receptor 92c [Halyomorpha halys]